MSLLPEAAVRTPNYYCTWAAQNYMYGCGFESLENAELEGARGARHARDSMNETVIFGPEGWARRFHPRAKKDLYLLLDDGWDVPPEVDPGFFGSLIPDERRFPSCKGAPADRLARLNQMAQDAGWRGIALWVAAQEAPALRPDKDGLDPKWQKDYWMERLIWSRQAGIGYWKVDWGAHAHDIAFRRNLTGWGHEAAPSLVIEHALCQSCINDERPDDEDDPYYLKSLAIHTGKVDGRLIRTQGQILSSADVLRSYDVLPYLAQAQTIERVSRLLAACQGMGAAGDCLINCEDEVYIAAALGLCAGVMRFPLTGLRPGTDADCTFPTSKRNVKRRMDEVARLTRFQAVMPAFGADEAKVLADEARLRDVWRFLPGQTWLTTALDQAVAQSAPARVSRGMMLPEVRAQGEAPFVLAARHPGGAAAIAAIGRCRVDDSYFAPLADVTLDMEGRASDLGIFGCFRSLRLVHAGCAGKLLFARDLLSDTAMDITSSVVIQDDTALISGELISRVGLDRAAPGDESEPGLLLNWL